MTQAPGRPVSAPIDPMTGLLVAVDHASDAMALLSPDWRAVFSNPAFRNTLELLPEASASEALSGRLDPVVFREVQKATARGGPWAGQVSLLRLDGHTTQLTGSVTPILDAQGAVQFLVVVFRDVTSELALESSLRQAQKMDALGTLAGGIAHDFNNILAAILGAAELLHLQMEAGSPLRPALEIIYQAGRRARELNKQILTFSRKGPEERVPFELSGLIKEATKLLKASLPKNIEVRAEVGAALWVQGDANQIHQVFMNLAINAYHAMGEAGGELVIDLGERDLPDANQILPAELSSGRYAVLSIRDAGCGMTPEVMAKIFEPFFTTKAVREGTGLGLAVVHGIVHKHQGTILVESVPGQGTLFQVFLPATQPLAPLLPSSAEPALHGTERILLVDDEDIVSALAKQGLQELGYQVTAKTSSKDALDAFLAHPEAFDLLVTDLAMPQLSGAQLTECLQKIRPELSSILVTGVIPTADSALTRSVHFDEVLLKPVVPADLARAIRRVMGSRPSQLPQPCPLEGQKGLPATRPTILLAEDNRETRTMIRACLVRGGYDVREAQDGQDAWASYQALPPGSFSLVMTDLIMPRMDGLDLVSKLRQTEPGLPVVILSSSDDPASVRSALHLRVSDYLSKPVDPMALLECVQHHLR